MTASPAFDFLAVCARGLESELANELVELGCESAEEERGGVRFRAPLRQGYRAALGSFLSSRVLLEIERFALSDESALYDALRQVHWQDHLALEQTFCFDVAASPAAEWITRQFAAQRAKDALADCFRAQSGVRPSVDRHHPDVRFHLYVGQAELILSVDLAGRGLHRRGAPRTQAIAPLKETLAAAVLRLGSWPVAEPGAAPPLLDPMCGSGTFLVEALCLATALVPGLRRETPTLGWRGHQEELWKETLRGFEERHRALTTQTEPLRLFARDASKEAVAATRAAVQALGLRVALDARVQRVEEMVAPESEVGLVVSNPPYGERVLEQAQALLLHETLGDRLRRHFLGWKAVILTPKELGACIGLRPSRRHVLYNGAIETRAFVFEIASHAPVEGSTPAWKKSSPEATMLANRLRKRSASLEPWAREQDTDAYRLYDHDLPEFPLVIDRFADEFVVYDATSRSRDPQGLLRRMRDARLVLEELFPQARVQLKTRAAAGIGERSALPEFREGHAFEVRENGMRFWVNTSDYLDCGLFLDERSLRRRIARESKGAKVLNLFAYTCSASVYAVAGGAATCVSVDRSASYLEWGRRNALLNGQSLDPHRFERDDSLD